MGIRWRNLHRFFARLHGGQMETATDQSAEPPEHFAAVYAEYASAADHANNMLQRHGARSAEFAKADIASMRLFHKAKRMHGLKKPRPSTD
jgi:hypothetical protein